MVCETNHNNHFILFCYALAMGCFTTMDANVSLNAYFYHRRGPVQSFIQFNTVFYSHSCI